MQVTFKRGDTVTNTQTGDTGVVVQPPMYMENSRQWNVAVRIPGRTMATWWYLPHVQADDPYKAVTAGDTVKIAGRSGNDMVAQVAYVSRNKTWVSLLYRGHEYIYRGPIFGIMPSNVKAQS